MGENNLTRRVKMSFDQNKALVRRIYDEIWNQHNPKAAIRIFARPDRVEKFVSEFLQAFPDLQHTLEGLIAEGEQVVARFSAHGTHLGSWKQFAATGLPIHYTGVTIATVLDGMITDHHTWWDEADVRRQINC
jgi:predicted ester cyclase